jgi:RHS repeat-associated protein
MHSVSLKFLVGILSFSDYYPFGMQMPGRNGSTGDYRYGFQGQETDDEVTGSESHVSYKYRMHDARLGRFLSLDPLAPDYPHNSPYAFSENRVIDGVELEGLEYTSTAGNGQMFGHSIVHRKQTAARASMTSGAVSGASPRLPVPAPVYDPSYGTQRKSDWAGASYNPYGSGTVPNNTNPAPRTQTAAQQAGAHRDAVFAAKARAEANGETYWGEGWGAQYAIGDAYDAIAIKSGNAELSNAQKDAADSETVSALLFLLSFSGGGVAAVDYGSLSFKELSASARASSTEMNAFFKSGGEAIPGRAALENYQELATRVVNGTAPAAKVTATSVKVQGARLDMVNKALKELE